MIANEPLRVTVMPRKVRGMQDLKDRIQALHGPRRDGNISSAAVRFATALCTGRLRRAAGYDVQMRTSRMALALSVQRVELLLQACDEVRREIVHVLAQQGTKALA